MLKSFTSTARLRFCISCHNIVLDSSIVDKVQYWMIALFGTIILVALDYALQFIYKRIAILVGKALRKNERRTKRRGDENDEDDDNRPDGNTPFDEFSDSNDCDFDKENDRKNDDDNSDS